MIKRKTIIDFAELSRRIKYDADTGAFHWIDSGNDNSGKPAGFKKKDGYVRIKFMGKEWMAHVIAWALTYGTLPELEIDHINRQRDDNRLSNLREVTHAENMRNMGINDRLTKKYGCSTTIRGCTLTKSGKWQAQIHIRGKAMYLGVFDTPEMATAAYLTALQKSGA